MTARERVLTSRLIRKIDNNESYARQIGLSCTVSSVRINKNNQWSKDWSYAKMVQDIVNADDPDK